MDPRDTSFPVVVVIIADADGDVLDNDGSKGCDGNEVEQVIPMGGKRDITDCPEDPFCNRQARGEEDSSIGRPIACLLNPGGEAAAKLAGCESAEEEGAKIGGGEEGNPRALGGGAEKLERGCWKTRLIASMRVLLIIL